MFTPCNRTIAAALALLVPALCASAQPRPAAPTDLPITEVPAASGPTLAVFWGGDGGWAELVDAVSKQLAGHGIAVVGLNSRSWMTARPRSIDDAARDTERVLRYYLDHWSRSRVVLLGYSRGAGFVPFILTRLPAELRARVVLGGMLGAEHAASVEFHLVDLFRSTDRPSDLPTVPEVQKVVAGGGRLLCLYGDTERDTICPALDPAKVIVVRRSGDHHFDRNYPAIAQDILEAIAKAAGPRSS